MTDELLYNLWMFLCAVGIIGWICTYKEAGKDVNFSSWFAYHLWRKEKE